MESLAIVEIAGPEDVIWPRVIGLTRSALPSTFHTSTTAYFDQLYPFHRRMAKGMAVNPTRISPTAVEVSQKLDLGFLGSFPRGSYFAYPVRLYIF